MKIAYLECHTGISGDMTLAALLDAGVPREVIETGIRSLGLEGVVLQIERVIKGGFAATAVRVQHPPQQTERHLSDIRVILDRAAALTERQKTLAWSLFEAIARAEAAVHGSTVERVHFHEVGAIDSIVDIVGVAIGFDWLNVDQVHCSPVPTGFGTVHIDHGLCPIPAPGTAELLKGIPLRQVPVEAELTTPTGAAIVRVLVDRFGWLPPMTIESIGYGAGTMTFPQRANLLRLFVGTAAPTTQQELICLLETNLDDTTAEVLGYARQKLEQAGALDVFTTAIGMKKNRPGTLLSILCRPEQVENLQRILFEETGSLGIRHSLLERTVLPRETGRVETVYGSVTGKVTRQTGQLAWFQPEFADCAALAAEQGIPIREIYRAAQAAFQPECKPPQLEHHHDHDHHHHDHDHSHDHDHDHHHDHG